METPLIFTTRGNMPVEQLEYRAEWYDDADNTTFVELYLYEGEVVKRSTHIMSKRGVFSNGIGSTLG